MGPTEGLTQPVGYLSSEHLVKIERALNGYIVNVGCKWVVFEDKAKMLSELSRYFDNPEAVAKEYLNKVLPQQL